jgi:hypothetical protein
VILLAVGLIWQIGCGFDFNNSMENGTPDGGMDAGCDGSDCEPNRSVYTCRFMNFENLTCADYLSSDGWTFDAAKANCIARAGDGPNISWSNTNCAEDNVSNWRCVATGILGESVPTHYIYDNDLTASFCETFFSGAVQYRPGVTWPLYTEPFPEPRCDGGTCDSVNTIFTCQGRFFENAFCIDYLVSDDWTSAAAEGNCSALVNNFNGRIDAWSETSCAEDNPTDWRCKTTWSVSPLAVDPYYLYLDGLPKDNCETYFVGVVQYRSNTTWPSYAEFF